ncbi:hypothetical protein OESDEN_18018 [Oesophagostomum dentatum]|uniref:Uncharacterized protein n=1 Tax=Oesophagostomum dentatum TaxID=61180 RepID=A0A0B1SGG8_OESDE|nr:hypothetical protein OESDEN_18018 [Oesophagostomum dentatum]
MKKDTLRQISRLTEELEAEFGLMGSMLRCGWRQTHFAAQLKKYIRQFSFKCVRLQNSACFDNLPSSLFDLLIRLYFLNPL